MLPCVSVLNRNDARDKCIHVRNLGTRGYYIQRLEIYKQLLAEIKVWWGMEMEVYKYVVRYWRVMIFNHDIGLNLLHSHANF